MDNPNQLNSESRRELRKRKTKNRLMNAAIGVVVVLIGFFLFALLFQDDEPVADDEFEDGEEDDVDIGFEDEESSGPEEAPDDGQDVPEEESDESEENGESDENGESEEGTETDDDGEDNGDDNGESAPSPPEDGEYEPIGTEQEEFTDSFERDSQNWDEMVMAMEYATDTSEEDWSHIEFLGNDGPGGAEGTFVHGDGTEYVVTMEWEDDEGWMPTNVEEN
ncbi:YrrS family protein [Salicibibacter cibarius]|uniref:YrrS family protein n=1 Tax=Salicibibacter cibarius TaxID=2743000 RepID=A0A7T7CBD2_9BACI|nr:YrrS family protein [Salicibibacter cibarius]QQK75694.1 YrrS family protein [Salicibibacter cibarius]